MRKKQFSVGVTEPTKRKLRQAAKQDGRSLSSYVERLIEQDVSGLTDPVQESAAGKQLLQNGKPRELVTA